MTGARQLRGAWLAIAALVLMAPHVWASPAYRVRDLRSISLPNPVPADCGNHESERRDLEGEASLAVNPTDPRHIVAAWLQDVREFPARESPVVVSRDGGRTFTAPALVPGWSNCTGGSDTEVNDPWVSIGPDGRAYMTAAAQDYPNFSNIEVAHSVNGGGAWSPVQRLDRLPGGGSFADSPRVTAHPRAGGSAYLVWLVQRPLSPTPIAETRFSRTTDGGETWSAPRTLYRNSPGQPFPQFNQIFVLPDGSLLNVFIGISRSSPRNQVLAMRSEDDGATWSSPIVIAEHSNARIRDPETEVTADYPKSAKAVGPDGTAYVVWQDLGEGPVHKLLLSRSADGGRSWSEPVTVTSRAAAIMVPSVAVAADGSVGVSWYDLRNDRRGDGETTTDAWFAHSHDDGRSFEEQHLAGPFDLRSTLGAPNLTGDRRRYFLGDLAGLAALGDGFGAAFTQGRPQASSPGDVFFAALRPRPRLALDLRMRVGSTSKGKACALGSVRARVVGIDAGKVHRVDFVRDGRRAARDKSAPFSQPVLRANRRRARSHRLAARARLVDGGEETLTQTFWVCARRTTKASPRS